MRYAENRSYWIPILFQVLYIKLNFMYQIRSSLKLKEIMKKILLLGNTLNQGTARGNKTFVYWVSLPVSHSINCDEYPLGQPRNRNKDSKSELEKGSLTSMSKFICFQFVRQIDCHACSWPGMCHAQAHGWLIRAL